MEVKRLRLTLQRLESCKVHPDWGSLDGKTSSEIADIMLDILINGSHLHRMRDNVALAARSEDSDPDHVPAVSNRMSL